jgi:pyridoxal phosphate enzyme (YggS family)
MVCVSKFHPAEAIMEAYNAGERDFGESRVQELLPKYEALPKDIRWHFIGHLQTNKVRQIVPFVHMIHSVDSVRLLETINREAEKIQRKVRVLLEVHVAKEETKSGFSPEELEQLRIKNFELSNCFPWVEVCGIMGMATNTDNVEEWRRCFREIKALAAHLSPITDSVASESSHGNRPQISMGMSDDYLIAIEEGSTMVRIGSSIFGERNYQTTKH